MLILGIESSCDDTAAAVVMDGRGVLSSVVSSQDSIHLRYGGVVPELASRRHIETIIPVVEEALKGAGAGLSDIEGIAVTEGPGLVGSILVGLSFGKALSFVRRVPFIGVNHIEAHAMSAFLNEEGEGGEGGGGGGEMGQEPGFPHISLVVSGGHTTILLVKGFTEFAVLGQTLDDAAGEAFDKTAKLLGLGYPGGVAIDALSKKGDPASVSFTRPYISKGSLDFSFSGLKTAVLNRVRNTEVRAQARIEDLAAGFQEAVVDVLVNKALWALEKTGVKTLVVGGGVACNSRLRVRLKEAAGKEEIRVIIPPARYCSDNGAMTAALGYHLLKKGLLSPLSLNARPNWDGF